MDRERNWFIRVNLTTLCAMLFFFILAPITGFPVTFNEAWRIIQMILPMLLSFVAAAAIFFVSSRSSNLPEPPANVTSIARVMIRGPLYIAIFGCILATSVFWYSNRHTAPAGSGFSLEQYCWWISAFLSILSVTTGIVVARLFPV
jgi:hypothetical protein